MTAAKPELVATGQLELDWNHSRFSGGQLLVDGVPTKAHQLPNGHLQISGEVGKSIRVVAKRACFQEVEWLFRPAENRVTHWREPTWNPRATLNLNWSKKDRSLAKFNDNNAATFVQAPTRQSPPVFLSATGGSVRYAVEPGSFQVRIRDASPDYAYKEFRKNVTLAAGEIASVDFVPAFKDVTQHGLAAEVFEATDIDLEKHHHTTVMHPAISDGSILVGTDYVSVRFRGYLKVRDAGDYCLHVEVDDTVAISLDGICIYDSQRETGKTARVSLTGRPQELQIDFRDTGGPELLQIKLHRLRSAAGGPLDAADAVELPPEALFVDFAYADKRPGAVIPTKPKNVTAEN
ncbi:MAG: PA14 domain-containing protein [Pirellulaceae bacterium]